MTYAVTPHDFSPKFLSDLCELLGVPRDGVIGIELRAYVNEAVKVTVEHYLMIDGKPQLDEAGEALIRELSHFELVKVEAPPSDSN